MFLECLDQRGFREARRGLGEMLFRVHRKQFHRIALLHRRQHMIRIVVGRVVLAFLVDGDIAGFYQRGAVRAQQVALRSVGAGEHVDGDGVEHGGRHLTGDGALPDQRVEAELVGIDAALDQLRGDRSRCRPDGLVRLLGIARAGLVDPHFIGDAFGAIELANDLADLRDRLVRDADGIGTHVGDQSDGPFTVVDALIQLLGEAHRALRGKAELA